MDKTNKYLNTGRVWAFNADSTKEYLDLIVSGIDPDLAIALLEKTKSEEELYSDFLEDDDETA